MKISWIFGLVTLICAVAISFGTPMNRPERSIPHLNAQPKQSDFVNLGPLKLEIREKRLNDESTPGKTRLNVILLLVNELGQSDLSSQVELQNKNTFPVQGHLLSCQENADSCDCTETLKTNVARLLSWAGQVKDMSTSVLYEMPAVGAKRGRRETVPEELDAFHVNEALSKIKESFSQTMLRSIGSNENAAIQPSFLRRLNFRQMAGRTLEELNGLPNDKGFIMVATASADELGDALDILRLHATDDTLVVVSGMCPANQHAGATFYARGPGASRLESVKHVVELPSAIREAIAEHECRISPEKCAQKTLVKRHSAVKKVFKRQDDATPAPEGDASTAGSAETEVATGENQDSAGGDGTPEADAAAGGDGGDAGDSGDSSSEEPAKGSANRHASSVIFASAMLLAVTKLVAV